MVQINFATREVSCKIVYYGPGLCGKTTNLQQVHTKAPTQLRGHLTSIATEGDRTLFFDFMPMELGTVAGMRTKLQLYTVPGQVYYNATRKIVLEGVDGVIFVADSSPGRRQANRESWQNLKENLREYGLDVRDIPLVLQFNKRDVPDAVPVTELRAELNELGAPTFEAVAVTGEGVMPTLRQLAALVLERLNEQSSRRPRREPAPSPAPPAATAVAAAPAASAATTAASAATTAASAATTAASAATTAAAMTGRGTGPARSGGRAERVVEREAEPAVTREASPAAAAKPKPQAERPARPVSPPRVTPAKLSEGSVSPPGVTTAKARVGDSATAVAGAPSGRAVSAGKPMVGWPVSRQRFTLADTRKKAPSWKKVLAILGVLAIVAVVLLVLFVRGW